jgi:hypothetical protein
VLLISPVQILFSGAAPGGDDERGVAGVLGILDVERGRVVHRTEYTPPAGLYGAGQKLQFTGFCFAGGRLWVCSFGEILGFDAWPPQQPSARISLPGFNDLHHCRPWGRGLAVANTGLETLDLVGFDGELQGRLDLLEGEAGARKIDAACDYRRIADTKPHRRHVNHLFAVDDVLWATQLRSSDAVPVNGPGRSLRFAAGMPHDGRWVGEHLVFTTTNGHLVFADPRAGRIERTVALTSITPDLDQLGWCRGVCGDPRAPERCFVAFSALRRSRWKEFGYWIRWRHPLAPSRIALYDIEAGTLAGSWRIGEGKGDVLFQLEALAPERWV